MTAPRYSTTDPNEGIGCRGVTLTAVAFVITAAVLWTIGLLMNGSDSCTGVCEWASFGFLFIGGPVSALFTVLGGTDLVVGWPVDIIAWVLLGGAHQRLSDEAQPWSPAWRDWYLRIIGWVALYAGAMALLVGRVR